MIGNMGKRAKAVSDDVARPVNATPVDAFSLEVVAKPFLDVEPPVEFEFDGVGFAVPFDGVEQGIDIPRFNPGTGFRLNIVKVSAGRNYRVIKKEAGHGFTTCP